MSDAPNQPAHADLLVRAGAVATMNAQREIVRDGAVAVAGSRIVAVGTAAELEREYAAARVVDMPGGLLTPGFVDAHDHPHNYLLRGLLDDVGDLHKRARYTLPFELNVTDDEAYLGARGAFAEMLLHGTTCVCDAASYVVDGNAQAVIDSGIRGIVSRFATDTTGFLNVPTDIETIVARGSEAVQRWNGAADGRLRSRFSLDHPFGVSDELCTAIVEQAAALQTGIVGHFHGRSADEYKGARNPHVERYASLGVLGPDTLLTHIGWLSAEDVAVFAEHDVRAVHCPTQSFIGAQGMIAHGVIPELIEAGVTVALATDAACISNSLDLVRVMFAAGAHRDVRMDPAVIGAHKAFEMATIDGARALGWDDEIGSLEVGKRADMVVFDTSGSEWQPLPLASPISRLVYSATGRSVHTVVVDGTIVVDAGTLTTVDPDVLVRETNEAAAAVHERLGFDLRDRTAWPVR